MLLSFGKRREEAIYDMMMSLRCSSTRKGEGEERGEEVVVDVIDEREDAAW